MGVVVCVWECKDLPFLLVMFVRALLVVGLCCPSKLLGRTTQMGQLNREAGLSIVDSNIHNTRSKRQADQLTQLLGAAGSVMNAHVQGGGDFVENTARASQPIGESVGEIVGNVVRTDLLATKAAIVSLAPAIVDAKVKLISSLIKLKLSLARQLMCSLICPGQTNPQDCQNNFCNKSDP